MCIGPLFIHCSTFGRNSQHSMLDFHIENVLLLKKKYQGVLKKNMLANLVNINSFVSDANMYDISNNICQLHHYHLEQYFIQQKKGYELTTFTLELMCLYFS